MTGDFTRDTFDRTKHFSRVLMQQGRVQLDADWNEQTSILLHYLRTLAADLLGPHAGPQIGMGFEIITDATKLTGAGLGKELLTRIGDGDFAIEAGRYYVNGILVENEQTILYSEQLGYPFSEDMTTDKLKGHSWLAYLDVWERLLTHVQDDHIREVALGGPDTCARAQVVWQLKVILLGETASDANCETLMNSLLLRKKPKLRARARLDQPPTQLCVIAPESRYRGAENQLYRVEVHQRGNSDTPATFKWSRENGSVVFPIASLCGTTVVVETLGRDDCLSLKAGDWVEVCDDAQALGEIPGSFAQIDTVNRDELTVTLKLPTGVQGVTGYPPADGQNRHPLLRRWDHRGDPATHGGALPVIAKSWIELEDGLAISFEAEGEYRTGDYWLIPTRVATGDVEWPKELDESGCLAPVALPPHGPHHYYAPIRREIVGGDPEDCRCPIAYRACDRNS